MSNINTNRRIEAIRPGFRFRKDLGVSRTKSVDKYNYYPLKDYLWIHVIKVTPQLIVTEEYKHTATSGSVSIVFGQAPSAVKHYNGKREFLNEFTLSSQSMHRRTPRFSIVYIDDKAPLQHIFPALAKELAGERGEDDTDS